MLRSSLHHDLFLLQCAPSEPRNSSVEEAESERATCDKQLTEIYHVMRSEPDKFGAVTMEDMAEQASKFYL